MSIHINNQFAKKRGIEKKLLLTVRAVMLEEQVDMVAGDFNGDAWRCPCGSDRRFTSLLKKLWLTRTYRCGNQVECWVNGPMCVVLSSRWTPK